MFSKYFYEWISCQNGLFKMWLWENDSILFYRIVKTKRYHKSVHTFYFQGRVVDITSVSGASNCSPGNTK